MEVHTMSRKYTKYPNTKLTEDHDAVTTELTIDCSGVTDADLIEYALQSLVIKWQGNARRGKVIPTTATYVVPKPGTRSQMDPITALLLKYGSAEEAIKALEAMKQ
jgi:hypothetical protein